MKALKYSVLLGLLATLSAPAQTNQTPPPVGQTSDEKLKEQAKLQGQVVNQVTGEPVRKANITLRPEGGGTNLKAATDNDGKFTIENIDPGRYTLAAERQGFVSGNYGASRPLGPGTPLDLKKSQVMKDISFKMTPQGIIAGKILDDEGEPVSGVNVQVLQYRYMMGKKRLIPAVQGLVMSNDLGEFRAPNLSPGRYYVATSPQKLMDIQSGVERSAAKSDEGLITTFYPNAADASSASPVEVGPGAEVRGIDLRLRKAKVFRISGKVMNAVTGTPMNPAMLMVYKREAGGMSTIPVSMYMVQGDKGAFELRNVPPGPYALLAVSTNPQDLMVQMTSVDVGDQDIENMVINVGGGFELPVTAKLEGVPAQPDQDPSNNDQNKEKTPPPGPDLSKIRIVLNLEDNPLAGLATTQLDKDGKGVIKRVNPDKYKFIAAGLPDGTYLKGARYGDRDALESGLDLSAGAGGTLQLTIGSPAAQLTGVVHNEKGEPVSGAIVTLVPKDAKGRNDLSRTGSTDQNGNLRMFGIVPHEYNVFAWEDIEAGAADDDDFRKPFDSKGTYVKLTEGAKNNVQLTVITRAQVEEEKAKR